MGKYLKGLKLGLKYVNGRMINVYRLSMMYDACFVLKSIVVELQLFVCCLLL